MTMMPSGGIIISSFLEPFSSHWRMSNEGLSQALKESLVVIDSSVLLDLYRVTPTARGEMIESLIAVKENIWIPHQVALEFHRNRIEAARDQVAFYDETCKSLETVQNQALQQLNEFANRSALDDAEKRALKIPLEDAFRIAISRVKSHQGVFDLTIGRVLNNDPVLEALADLLDGRVGQPLSESDSERAHVEAAHRKENRIPPGYKDRAKRTNPHGDYLWWEQTLVKAVEASKPVLIVSNDEKEDWINKRLNFSLGAREELAEEAKKRADAPLRIVNFAAFLEAAKSGTKVSVSRETLSQAKNTRRHSEQPLKRIVVSREIVADFEAFIIGAIDSRGRELEAAIADRIKVEGDPDMEGVVENVISRHDDAIVMYRNWLTQLREAVKDAPSLKGDLALWIESKSLRHSLLRRVLEARQEGGEGR